jgi:hypothetical protein
MTAIAAIAGSLLLQLAALLFLAGFMAGPAAPIYLFLGVIVVVASAGVFSRHHSRLVMFMAALTGYALGALALSQIVSGSFLPAMALVVFALLAADVGALLTFGALRLRLERA